MLSDDIINNFNDIYEENRIKPESRIEKIGKRLKFTKDQ